MCPPSHRCRNASSTLQVAPKEVLVARGCLSTPTQRLLGQPPVPLKQAIVVPGHEFPFPEASVQSMQDEVGSSCAGSNSYACFLRLHKCLRLVMASNRNNHVTPSVEGCLSTEQKPGAKPASVHSMQDQVWQRCRSCCVSNLGGWCCRVTVALC